MMSLEGADEIDEGQGVLFDETDGAWKDQRDNEACEPEWWIKEGPTRSRWRCSTK
jgi:hypothetical protein